MSKEEMDKVLLDAKIAWNHLIDKNGQVNCNKCGKIIKFTGANYLIDHIPEPQFAGLVCRCVKCIKKWGLFDEVERANEVLTMKIKRKDLVIINDALRHDMKLMHYYSTDKIHINKLKELSNRLYQIIMRR